MGLADALLLAVTSWAARAAGTENPLLGTWNMVSAMFDNQSLDAESLARHHSQWVITPTRIVWNTNSTDYKYTLNSQKGMKTIDLVVCGNARLSFLGIYEIEGDRLKVCIDDASRPTTFTARRTACLLEFDRAKR